MFKKISSLSLTWKIVIVIVIVIVLWAVYHFAFAGNKNQYQFVTVQKGSITEVVNVTGNTTPVQSLDLAFQNGGTIAAVNYPVGSTVRTGDVIARLDTQALQAQLAQAQANVDSEQATLQKLQAGATPQSIAVSQTAVSSAEQTLVNSYSAAANTITSAYASANDAVRNQLAPFFSSPETNNPQLTFSTNNSQTVNDIQLERLEASTALNSWQAETTDLTATSASTTLNPALQNATSYLGTIKNLLITASDAVTEATGLPPTTSAAYKEDITTGLNEVNAAITSVNNAAQSIASENAALAQAQAQLNLTLAGSTSEDIAAQQAQVEQAQASMQNVQVQINEASLVSPINGVITTQNAKVGQIASPGAVLVSVISSNNLEVDADVAEVDIGKIAVGDAASMTFDAFPGQTFTGKVFYIDPAQTVISGVVDYLVKVSFDNPGSEMKSGLTANLDIMAKTDQNALILPQYAVVQNASGTFVETLSGKNVNTIPVTLGIQDQSGNVEIASGVTQGEQVINVGLKQ